MQISVIVCTYNRCQVLAKALESIASSVFPNPVEWEVLVVDNNSSDQTREVVERCAVCHPDRFLYIFEPRQGKSYALNTAIREARGSVLAFTDDDVTVDSMWLCNLTAALNSGEWVGAAGRIIPTLEKPLPRWLSLENPLVVGPFVAFDCGNVAGRLTKLPFGANMAFRSDMFEKYGGFRTDLGRNGEKLMSGEDTEFNRRLMVRGEPLRYEPSAIVYHSVPEHRTEKGYILTWHFWYAVSEICETGPRSHTKWLVHGVPLVLFRRLARWSLQWLVSTNPSTRFTCRLNIWCVAGTIVGYYRWSRSRSLQSAPAVAMPGKNPQGEGE